MAAALPAKLSTVVQNAAEDLQAYARTELIVGPSTGVVYGAHQASAPGEAPAYDSGLLFETIIVENTGQFTRSVTAGNEYAVELEFGTANMAPRPYMTPAVDKVRPQFVRAVERAVRP